MVLGAILASLAAIVGFTVGGVQAGVGVLQAFFQMLPESIKALVFAGIITGGGVFWIEMTGALGFKLQFFGIDLTLAPFAVAIGASFFIILHEIISWYSFWMRK